MVQSSSLTRKASPTNAHYPPEELSNLLQGQRRRENDTMLILFWLFLVLMCVINNTLIILLTSPHFAPSSWWDLHFSAISIQHAEALGGNVSTWFLFILLFGSWDLYLSYKYKVLCCVLCVCVMCTDVWTSCSIQLSVRQGRRHAWGRCALITSTIVKVIFCNGVIQDCDCKGGILKGSSERKQPASAVCWACSVYKVLGWTFTPEQEPKSSGVRAKSSLVFHAAESPMQMQLYLLFTMVHSCL